MTYAVDLTLDVEFRGDNALAHYLDRAAWESPGGDPAAYGWAIVASFSEFASGALDGLHLTGVGGGRLLDGFAQRLRLLAISGDGVVAGVGEDGTRWCHRLERGRIITVHGAGPHQPGRFRDRAPLRDHSTVDRLPLACVPVSRLRSSWLFEANRASPGRWHLPDEADVHSPVTYHCR